MELASPDNGITYPSLSLPDLVSMIVEKDDFKALEELHKNRTLFNFGNSRDLLFIEYLNILRDNTARYTESWRNSTEIADRAYDITVDKFTNLPKKSSSLRQGGSDCRYYFNAFLKKVEKSFDADPPTSQLEEEQKAAILLQGFVNLQFYRSRMEAARKSNLFWSRYNWKVRGHTITVWLPVALKGHNRRKWLEENIDNLDPETEGERLRVQAIINLKFVKEQFIQHDDRIGSQSNPESHFFLGLEKNTTISLAQMVVDEKVLNIHKQRKAVKALGKRRLKQMILRIFKDISSDDYKDTQVAREYGIPKATFSRFASSKWSKGGQSIPDLWINTAHVISTHPVFREVTKDHGMWDRVEAVLEDGSARLGEKDNHD